MMPMNLLHASRASLFATRRHLLKCGLIAVPAMQVVANAAILSGVNLPEFIQSGNDRLAFLGGGIGESDSRGVKTMTVGVYSAKPEKTAQDFIISKQKKAILISYHRTIDNKELTKRMIAAIRENAPRATLMRSLEAVSEFGSLFAGLRKFEPNDVSQISFTPNLGTELIFNGRRLGKTIVGDDFGEIMFSIWFGPKPLAPKVKSSIFKD